MAKKEGTRLIEIGYFLILLMTIFYWFFIYKGWTTEYDQNIFYLICASMISILTAIILINIVIADKRKGNLKFFVQFFVFFTGTPITWVYFFIYLHFFN